MVLMLIITIATIIIITTINFIILINLVKPMVILKVFLLFMVKAMIIKVYINLSFFPLLYNLHQNLDLLLFYKVFF